MIVNKVLSNGIRVVIETMPNVRSAALGIYVEAGSGYETDRQNGISHMLEHMLFKGTKSRSAREIARETALLGDDMNAYTAKEMTCFYGRVLDEQLPIMAELMGDMLTHSLFAEADLQREKGVILDEIDMYEDSPEDLVQEQLQKLVWGDHPLGFIISGSEKQVKSISREELIAFWREHYTARRMVLSVAGNVEPEAVYTLLEQCFGGLPEGTPQKRLEAPLYRPARACFHKEMEQVHICIGFPGVSHTDSKSYALSMMNNILGGSSCSRLFQRIREEQGLCYSLYSYGSSYHQTGIFQIYCGTSVENVEQVCSEIMGAIKQLTLEGPEQAELEQSYFQIRSELLLSMESTHNRMNHNARCLVYMGRLLSIEEMLEELKQVTRDDVVAYMEEFCRPELASGTLVGNLEENPELEKQIHLF